MRLNNFEVGTIKECVYSLDKDAKVYLFGSCADDTARGGDINLLIISEKLN